MMKTTDLSQVVTSKLYHIMLYRVHLTRVGFKLTTLVVIGTDCIGSCKFNYHTITITMVPSLFIEVPVVSKISNWSCTACGQKWFRFRHLPYIFYIKPFIFITFSWSHSLSDFHEIFSIKCRNKYSFFFV